jgi:hypothetical protein
MRTCLLLLNLALATALLGGEKPTAPSVKSETAATSEKPRVVFSTALSEVVATNLTIAAGAYQSITAETDFTGADSVNIGFYTTNSQNLANCTFTIWWAFPNMPNFVATFFFNGNNFPFTNSGGLNVLAFGNQLMIGIQNNSTSPVTISQITAYANAR